MASLAALATRNFTTRLALILIVSPVAGLRPTRALRLDFQLADRASRNSGSELGARWGQSPSGYPAQSPNGLRLVKHKYNGLLTITSGHPTATARPTLSIKSVFDRMFKRFGSDERGGNRSHIQRLQCGWLVRSGCRADDLFSHGLPLKVGIDLRCASPSITRKMWRLSTALASKTFQRCQTSVDFVQFIREGGVNLFNGNRHFQLDLMRQMRDTQVLES